MRKHEGIIKEVIFTTINGNESFVSMEDHLKVVEEKEVLQSNLRQEINVCLDKNRYIEKLQKELMEKDEEIESLKDSQTYHMITKEKHNETLYIKDETIRELERHIEIKQKDLKTLSGICNEQRLEIKELKEKDEEISKLQDEIYDLKCNIICLMDETLENKEETWTLRYTYESKDKKLDYVQKGILKEDAEELIGMDSDNWIKYSLEKEVKW